VTARNIDDFVQSEVHLIDGRWILSPQNQGSAQVRGIDLEAKLPLAHLWAGVRKGIDLRASIGRYWSSVSSVPGPRNRLDRQPPLTSNLGIDYKGTSVSAGAAFGYVAADGRAPR
jgi:outer membrane receptor for ferrienterochelin and colicins